MTEVQIRLYSSYDSYVMTWNLTPKKGRFPAISQTSNNFRTELDRQKMSTDYTYKIGIVKSSDDVTSGLTRTVGLKQLPVPLACNEISQQLLNGEMTETVYRLC
jgi:hypothetical protein